MFDLKSPCTTCPFRIGQGGLFILGRPRVEGIVAAPAFQCHKTIDYENGAEDENGDCKPLPGDKPQQCAGLMAVLHRSNRPNQIMQVAMRLGYLDPAQLDPRGVAYASIEEAISAHTSPGDKVQDSLDELARAVDKATRPGLTYLVEGLAKILPKGRKE